MSRVTGLDVLTPRCEHGSGSAGPVATTARGLAFEEEMSGVLELYVEVGKDVFFYL